MLFSGRAGDGAVFFRRKLHASASPLHQHLAAYINGLYFSRIVTSTRSGLYQYNLVVSFSCAASLDGLYGGVLFP